MYYMLTVSLKNMVAIWLLEYLVKIIPMNWGSYRDNNSVLMV